MPNPRPRTFRPRGPASPTGPTSCSRTRARPRPSASRPATPRRPTSSRRTVSGRSCRRPRPRDTTQGTDEGAEPVASAPGYVDLPGEEQEPGVAELMEETEPEVAEEAPNIQAVEAAADHFAESVRDEVHVEPESVGPQPTEEVAIAQLLGEEGDEGSEAAEPARTVRVGAEGFGGPSWQEPTAIEVGAEPERKGPGRDVPMAFITGIVLVGLAVGGDLDRARGVRDLRRHRGAVRAGGVLPRDAEAALSTGDGARSGLGGARPRRRVLPGRERDARDRGALAVRDVPLVHDRSRAASAQPGVEHRDHRARGRVHPAARRLRARGPEAARRRGSDALDHRAHVRVRHGRVRRRLLLGESSARAQRQPEEVVGGRHRSDARGDRGVGRRRGPVGDAARHDRPVGRIGGRRGRCSRRSAISRNRCSSAISRSRTWAGSSPATAA